MTHSSAGTYGSSPAELRGWRAAPSAVSESAVAHAAPVDSLRLAAWMPASLVDWPGRIASTAFISGCNLRCPFCHNPTLLEPTDCHASTREFIEYLEKRRDWIDGVVVTGGEPTTDPALFDLLRRLAAMRLPVKLDTNGTRPDVLARILASGLVAFVALDVKAAPEGYDRACGKAGTWRLVAHSIRVTLESGVDHEFRTTSYPEAVDGASLVQVARLLTGGHRYVLQQFRPQHALSASARARDPYPVETLRDIAEECSRYLPTIVRGA